MDPDSAIGYMILAAESCGWSEFYITTMVNEMLDKISDIDQNKASQAYGDYLKYKLGGI